ncbi:MAG TPA: ABC transporter permease [Bacteroidota bacterium]
MFSNNIKIAIRNLMRHKGYSAINIFGLAAGLVCCLLIILFIAHEVSYDRFHRHADRIFRVVTEERGERGTARLATTNTPLAPLLATEFPGMETIIRLIPYSVVVKVENGQLFQEDKLLFVDTAFFDLFSFELLHGDRNTALLEPFSLVLTQELAMKYFGSVDVVGRFLTLEAKHVFKVTGVVAEIPKASSINFSMLATINSAPDIIGSWIFHHWYHPPIYTFVRLKPNASSEEINAQIPAFTKARIGERQAYRSYSLQSLTAIHFTPELTNELVPTTSPVYMYTLSALAALILTLACINFTNLATVRSLARAKEVGLRKVVGAERQELIRQFLSESTMYVIIAFVIALVALEFLLPFFTSLTGKELDHSLLRNPYLILTLIALLFGVGVVAGVYPAFVLSNFQPIRIFRGEAGSSGSNKRGIRLRSALVVVQFAISITLIVSTAVIYSQLSFIQDKNLGFNKEQVVVVPVRDETIQQNFLRVKTSLQAVPGVSSVTALSNFPWERGFYDFPMKVEGMGKEFETDAPTLLVDEDFLRTLGMEISVGRDFLKNSSADANEAFIINATAAKKFGFENPVGMKLTMNSVSSGNPKKGEVIGVVKDFHFQSLYHEVEPLVITISPEIYYIDNVVVRLKTEHISETLSLLEAQWHNIVPDRPFEFFFLDQAFNNLYRSETQLASIFNTFSLLAVVIGCLGLFGLASFTIQQRTKEIGIRKVMGASVAGVVVLLSKDFIMLVLIANILAWPIAYYAMSAWLQDFAYRVDMSWWIFAGAGGLALFIALLTVSIQAVRAALANPVEALRYE